MKRIIPIIMIVIIAFVSCKKEDESEVQYATLIIKPKMLGCSNDNVRIRLFENETDYKSLTNAIIDTNSVENNPVVFNDLESKIYFFHLSKPCSMGGVGIAANNFCDPSIRVYKTNGSLNPIQPQEIEVGMCY